MEREELCGHLASPPPPPPPGPGDVQGRINAACRLLMHFEVLSASVAGLTRGDERMRLAAANVLECYACGLPLPNAPEAAAVNGEGHG